MTQPVEYASLHSLSIDDLHLATSRVSHQLPTYVYVYIDMYTHAELR